MTENPATPESDQAPHSEAIGSGTFSHYPCSSCGAMLAFTVAGWGDEARFATVSKGVWDTALAQDAARRKEDSRRMDLVQRLARLTPREQQIMTLVATGLSNKEIGRQLDISFRTVEGHRQRVAEKMQASSLAELVEMARICGLT